MLRLLRKYSRSWFIALAIGAIVVVFIFWGVGSFSSPRFQEVAEVNGTPILLTTYLRQYHNTVKEYQERSQGELTEEMIQQMRLKETTLQHLVEEALLLQVGERLGLRVTDEELRQRIQGYPAFQREDGKFDEKRYVWVLSRNHLTPQDFEEQERQRLLIRKVVDEVTSFAKVSDAELKENFRLGKEAVEVHYVVLSPEQFQDQSQPGEAAIARYYQEHQDKFRVPERTRVHYLVWHTKDFLDRVKLSPNQVEEYLAEHLQEYSRSKLIRARHLLLKTASRDPAKRQATLRQAGELLQKARQGEDFAQLVKAYSQDAATKEKGGELGDVRRGQQPPEWDKVAFSLPPGQVGQAITPQGTYLIKVEEIKETEKLPDAEKKVEQHLKNEAAKPLAKEAAEEARGELSRSPMGEVAKKYGVRAQETPLLALRDAVPGLGVTPAFNQAALSLKPKEVSRLVDLPSGYAVLQGVEHQAQHLPPLEKIKDQVRDAVKKQQAQKQAQEEANRWSAALGKGKTLAQVAAQAKLPVKDSGFFTRSQGFLGQRQAETLTSAAFQLSKEKPYPGKTLEWRGKYYLLAFKARKEPDPKEFQQERDKFKDKHLEQKRQTIFVSWLDGERKQAKIKLYKLP